MGGKKKNNKDDAEQYVDDVAQLKYLGNLGTIFHHGRDNDNISPYGNDDIDNNQCEVSVYEKYMNLRGNVNNNPKTLRGIVNILYSCKHT